MPVVRHTFIDHKMTVAGKPARDVPIKPPARVRPVEESADDGPVPSRKSKSRKKGGTK